MKKISFLLITTLLLSGCASPTNVSAPGIVASCDQIKLLESADKSVLMGCLDGSSEINFHQLKGPLLINVWGSWCEGCKQEMPYFIELYQNPYLDQEFQLPGLLMRMAKLLKLKLGPTQTENNYSIKLKKLLGLNCDLY